MICRTPEPRLEPNHHLEEYLMCDESDFIQTCINSEEQEPCTRCGTCEEVYYACSEDEYDMEE